MNGRQLDAAFHALSDPTRRAILTRLAVGQATVTELSEPFGLSQPTISSHLKVLEGAGLVEGARDAQRRPRSLVPEAIKDVAAWIDLFRDQWERRLNNLETHVLKIHDEES